VLVIGAWQPLVVGVVLAPGIHGPAVGIEQHRVVIVGVLHPEPGEKGEIFRIL
jgi:hypothetical protein